MNLHYYRFKKEKHCFFYEVGAYAFRCTVAHAQRIYKIEERNCSRKTKPCSQQVVSGVIGTYEYIVVALTPRPAPRAPPPRYETCYAVFVPSTDHRQCYERVRR